MPRHGMSLSVDSAPLTIKRGQIYVNYSATTPAMYGGQNVHRHTEQQKPDNVVSTCAQRHAGRHVGDLTRGFVRTMWGVAQS